MRPCKAKSFIPEIADELEISDELVSAIVNFYWQEVRKSLSAMKNPRVHVTNLGDFVIKHWKLDDKITRYQQFEENNRLKGLQKITARFKTVETLFELNALKQMLQEEQQRSEFIKMFKRTNHVADRERNQDLENQGTNS